MGACGNSIVDPSITATADRVGVMTGSIVGSGYYLSPFYATISLTAGASGTWACAREAPGGPACRALWGRHEAHSSARPAGVGQINVPHLSSSELVATNYEPLAPLRTGDYSAATLDELGNVWLVAEYSSSRNASAASGSGGTNPPVIGLNWGTWIMQLDAGLS